MDLKRGALRSALLAWSLTCLTVAASAQEPPPPTPSTPATQPGDPAAAPAVPAPTAPVLSPDAAAPATTEPVPEDTPPAGAAPEPGADLPLEPGQMLPPPSAAAADPAAETREFDARVAALDAYLKDQQPRSRAYFGTWVSIMGALTVGQALQATFNDDPGTRASYIAGSSFSAVGLALVLISPTPGRSAYRKYSAMPDGTLEEKKAKAIQGEEWLRGEAAAVRRTKSWFTHVLGATLGVGGFLGLYLGYDDNLENALRTGVGTIVVTELRILTRPYRAIRYLDGYRNSPTTTPSAATFALSPMMLPRGQGLMLAGTF
jgi:hypothetical protein